MGVSGFWEWLRNNQKFVPQTVSLRSNDPIAVDTKAKMYEIGYGIPFDVPNLAEQIANRLWAKYQRYTDVIFVNDGELDASHPKQKTLAIRHEQKKRSENSGKRKHAELEEEIEQGGMITAEEAEKMDKLKRSGRGVPNSVSRRVLEILKEKGANTFQCEKEEADDKLVELAREEGRFIDSNDSDLLVFGGCRKLVRGLGTGEELLYDAEAILQHTQLTAVQLKEMACLSGCDPLPGGIRGFGMSTACTYIKRWGSIERMVRKFCPKDKNKWGAYFTDDFMACVKTACLSEKSKRTAPSEEPVIEAA